MTATDDAAVNVPLVAPSPADLAEIARVADVLKALSGDAVWALRGVACLYEAGLVKGDES